MRPRRDRPLVKGSVKTVQKLPPGVSQPVLLLAAARLLGDGPFQPASHKERLKVRLEEVDTIAQTGCPK